MEKMLEFIKENEATIAITLSIASLVLALAQLICNKLKAREKFEILLNNVQQDNIGEITSLLLSITIINKSSSPLTITGFNYYDGNKKYFCTIRKQWIGEHYYPQFPETDIPRTERVFSANFPICLQANDARFEVIKFELPQRKECIMKGDVVELEVMTDKHGRDKSLICLDDKADLTYL